LSTFPLAISYFGPPAKPGVDFVKTNQLHGGCEPTPAATVHHLSGSDAPFLRWPCTTTRGQHALFGRRTHVALTALHGAIPVSELWYRYRPLVCAMFTACKPWILVAFTSFFTPTRKKPETLRFQAFFI